MEWVVSGSRYFDEPKVGFSLLFVTGIMSKRSNVQNWSSWVFCKLFLCLLFLLSLEQLLCQKNHQIFKQTDFFSVIKARPHQSFFISIKLLVRLKYFFKEDFQIGVTQGELLSIAEQMWREFSLLQRKKQLRPLPYRRCHRAHTKYRGTPRNTAELPRNTKYRGIEKD